MPGSHAAQLPQFATADSGNGTETATCIGKFNRGWLWVLVLILLSAGHSPVCENLRAATYYLDPSGIDGAAGNSTNTPWATFGYAASHVTNGDTIIARGGHYSGPNHRIDIVTTPVGVTVMAFPGETVSVENMSAVSQYPVILEGGTSNWTFSGITYSNDFGGFYIRGGSCYNTITNCTVGWGSRGSWSNSVVYIPPAPNIPCAWCPLLIQQSSCYNKALNCTFRDFGYEWEQTPDSPNWYPHIGASAGPRIGYGPDVTDNSWYNLISGCTFFHGGHDVMFIEAGYNVIQNCYFHNEPWMANAYTNGLDRNLFPLVSARISKTGEDSTDTAHRSVRNVYQNNVMMYSGYPGDVTGSGLGIELMDTECIIRGNVIAWTATGGIMLYNGASNNCIYANTIFDVGANLTPAQYQWTQTNAVNNNINVDYFAGLVATYGTSTAISNRIVNNIVFGSRYGAAIAGNVYNGYQLVRTNFSQNPSFINTNGFGDYYRTSGLPNLRLQGNSACIDAGAFLTTITSPSGSGTTVTLADARFFTDGNRCIPGDTIQLQGQAVRAQIMSLNYTSGVITVNTSLTWTNGQGVSLAYNGTAPDMGAFEYSSSGGAAISVTPPNLGFGPVGVGTSSNLSYIVQNMGGSTLSGTSSVALPFSIVSGGVYNLAAGQSQAVTVQYSPTQLGTDQQTVTFTGGGGAVSTVSGSGTVPVPVVSNITQSGADVDPVTPGLQVFAGSVEQYSGSASDPAGNSISWQWIYTVNGGPETILQSGTGAVTSVSYNYTQGSAGNTYIWKLRVSNGFTNTESDLTVGVEAPPPGGNLSFAAPSGTLSGPFTVTNGYVSQLITTTNVASGGHALYSFTITNAGAYVVQILVNAPNDAANSIYVNIDSEPQDPFMISDIPITSGFEQRIVSWRGNGTFDNNQFVPNVFNLTVGTHQLIIVGREAGVQLQSLSILKLPAAPQNLRIVSGS